MNLRINDVLVEPLVEFTLHAVIHEYNKVETSKTKPKPPLVVWLEKEKMIRVIPETKAIKRVKAKDISTLE